MSKHLTRDLERLQRNVLTMAGAVEDAIYQSAKSLRERDSRLATAVIAGDATIDEQENTIQEECLKILALHQPVAVDLRRIAAVFSITTDLERMGDLAVDIAERAVTLSDPHNPSALRFPIPDKLDRMTDLAAALVRQALDAFVNLDPRAARRVIRLDDEIDRCHAELVQELIARMKEDSSAVEAGVSLFSVAKHLERIGDHATNIAEDVVYLVEGEMIRHRSRDLLTPETIR